MKKRIGVYVCHCGGNISDYVNIQQVKEAVKGEEGVYLVKNTLFACSDATQKEMEADIRANELDAIVVASCSPKLHVPTFRGVADRAGLNRYHYVQVNIREQSSWAHSDHPPGATEKAIHLVKAGIKRAFEAETLEPKKIPAHNVVTVIGAGVGGMKTAIALADMGSDVFLLEKDTEVGGHVREQEALFPGGNNGPDLVHQLLSEVKSRPRIKLFTHAELIEKKGSVGDFECKIRKEEELLTIRTGAFVVNTGFEHYVPAMQEYGFGTSERILTLPEFLRLTESFEEGKPFNYLGRRVETVSYIYCVGARETKADGNKSCSRVCCTAAIHAANTLKKKHPEVLNLHFHKGIRTYGKQELLYEESCRNGDLYIQFEPKAPPTVELQKNNLRISAADVLTAGKTIEADTDLVVLVTSMMPRKNPGLDSLLKIPTGRDGFYNEIHMKLRPVETVIEGVLIAGSCQSPKNVLETVQSSMAAAAKANALLNKGEMTLEPTLARINPEACVWCDLCTEACPYDAIRGKNWEDRWVATVLNENCKGCGMCTPVCPTDAIDLAGYTNAQIEGMIEALAEV